MKGRLSGRPFAWEDAVKQKKEEVLATLLRAHEAYYDVEREYAFCGRQFPGYAEFHSHGEKYVLSKRAKLWEAEVHEYLFFCLLDRADQQSVFDLVDFVLGPGMQKVVLGPNHMTSYLTLVVIADTVDASVSKMVRRCRFRKNFLFGLRGWADLRLAVVGVENHTVYTNGQGKELKSTLRANLVKALDSAGALKGKGEEGAR